MTTGGDACAVTIRIRPSTHSINHSTAWSFNQNSISLNGSEIAFAFDNVVTSDNLCLYKQSAEHLVWSAMTGISGTILAYGQTASGKTFSMMGTDNQPGIIPQSVDHIFSYIREQADNREYLLRVAYIEIYNECINDLLCPSTMDLRILEDKKRGTYISPLKEEIVTSPTQVMRIIQKGEANRHFGTTDYNAKSSRSHTILQIIIESRDSSSVYRKNKGSVTISQLNLIDLAGSEKADTDTDRRKEGAFINKSLLSLGNVIKTQNLPECFNLRCLETLKYPLFVQLGAYINLITPSPNAENKDESLSTLKFASRVKRIPVKAKPNRCLDDEALIEQYKKEITTLRLKLADTNRKLDRERSLGDVSVLRAEKELFEQRLHESHLVRLALKERIEHLTKMFLTSETQTPSIINWNVAKTKSENGCSSIDKRASVMLEGLLPSSLPTISATDMFDTNDISIDNIPSTALHLQHQLARRTVGARANRLSRQMTDQEFYSKHISEIVVRDEKITRLLLLLSQCKTLGCESVNNAIFDFEGSEGESVISLAHLSRDLTDAEKGMAEMEVIVTQQQERIDTLEGCLAAGVKVDDDEADEIISRQQQRIQELEMQALELQLAVHELQQ